MATAPVPGSIRETVLSSMLVTQTPPLPAATPPGSRPMPIVAVSVLVAGSMRWTESDFGAIVGSTETEARLSRLARLLA